jgi:hypothetical protein
MRTLGALLGLVALNFLLPASLPAESLYAVVGGALIRANLDGSAVQVVTQISNPSCAIADFAIDTSGAPYLSFWCSTPTENTVTRLGPNLQWEVLLDFGTPGVTVSSLELADWSVLPMVLYYSKVDEIRVMALDRGFDIQIVSGSGQRGQFVSAFDVDSTHRKIYWVRVPMDPAVLGGVIMRADRDRGQADAGEVFVSLPNSKPQDVSVDEHGAMVYWSDSASGSIQRAPVTDGQMIETVLQGLTQPTGIAVEPTLQKLYWAETQVVRRSNLDGSMSEDVLHLPGVSRIGFRADAFVGIKATTLATVKQLYR